MKSEKESGRYHRTTILEKNFKHFGVVSSNEQLSLGFPTNSPGFNPQTYPHPGLGLFKAL